MGASPLIILIVNAGVFGIFASLLIVISASVDSWQKYSFNEGTLKDINDSNPNVDIINVSDHLFYKVTETKASKTSNATKVYYVYPTYSGIWRLCDYLTNEERELTSKKETGLTSNKCFVFVKDYDDNPAIFSKEAMQIARLQNSAASCYLVVLIDLIAAGVIGMIGIFRKQVASCMVTGVLYCMAALFGVFGLSMFHTKNYYEKYECYAMELLPQSVCPAREVTIEWAIPLAWVGVIFCALASVLWWIVARALRVILAKTML
ncbi:uncharacterized protein LOC121380105 [Gigantopelta aegis]|uniref:uncharacterized protein LOC121380105 n=1 Tax=Gigantopelta aegis TaxID=1735272 RepID=UPI001B88D1A4|nr:uncharacterized protein LOC121380105 [Gigantopelta aegis]